MVAMTVDGVAVRGIKRLEILQCGHFAAGRFRVMAAMNAMSGGAAWYAGLQSGVVTIGVGAGMAVSLLTGQIDNVTLDFAMGEAVISGRDLAARLIDAEVEQTFANRTSSQIAAAFAADAGLVANVTATARLVGQYYELAHARTGLGLHARHATRWDLLAALAEAEQFSLSVTGTTLNFMPAAPEAPMPLTFGRDLLTLAVDRSLGLAAPKVTVKSWNPKLKQSFTQTVGTGGNVTLVRPNLTQNQVERMAAARQSELAAQAVLLRASMPGETMLGPDSPIALRGTGTALDGTYAIRAIERLVDTREGFVQHFEAVRTG